MDGNILTGKAPEKETRQNGNTAIKNMPVPNKPAARLSATDNHHTITNTLMTNTKLFCCVPALLLLLSLTAIGCRKNPVSPVTEPKISITVEDMSCTEAWVRIKTEGLEKLQNIQFLVNDKPLPNFVLLNSDTLVYVESLQVKQQYTFTVTGSYRNEYDKEKPVSSAKQTATTMDTTSHDFVWQSWNLGTSHGSSSVLHDVGIIDENNIWAVGEVFLDDTNQTKKYINYNLVKWDGTGWKLEHVPFYNTRGDTFNIGIRAICVFDKNNIVIGTDAIWYWDGKRFSDMNVPQNVFFSWVNKIWGISRNNFYIVGNNGSIAHYHYGTWIKIDSKTDLDIVGISGYYDKEKNKTIAFCVAARRGAGLGHKIIRIEDNFANMYTSENVYPGDQSAIWLCNKNLFFLGGNYIYKGLPFREKDVWKKINEITTPYYTLGIYGVSPADVFYSGSFCDLGHFNGRSWKNYLINGNIPAINGEFYGLAATSRIVCAVGYNMTPGTVGQARITLGKR